MSQPLLKINDRVRQRRTGVPGTVVQFDRDGIGVQWDNGDRYVTHPFDVTLVVEAEPERVNRPGGRPRYRVGRRCPWNVYRINPDSDDRDHDERFAVAFEPADGQRIADALDAFEWLPGEVDRLNRVADSAYQRADEQTKATIDCAKKCQEKCQAAEGVAAQAGKAEELLTARVAELTRERDEARAKVERLTGKRHALIATLTEEIAWQKDTYSDGTDKVATGRIIGMEDALRSVREAGEPPASNSEAQQLRDAMDRWAHDDGVPPGRYRVHAEIGVERRNGYMLLVPGEVEHGVKVGGLLNLGLVLLEPLIEVVPGVPSGGDPDGV